MDGEFACFVGKMESTANLISHFYLRYVKRDLLVPSLLTGHVFEPPPPPAEHICSPTSKKKKTR